MGWESAASLIRQWNTTEVAISKAEDLPEFVMIAEMEERLRRAMRSEWEEKAAVAIERAVGDPPDEFTAEFLLGVPEALIRGFRGWPSGDLKGLVDDVVRETYQLSAQTIARKDSGVKGYQRALVQKADASFSVPDMEAMTYLSDSQVFWLGDHWDSDTVDAIRQSAWLELLGRSGVTAGRDLRRRVEQIFGVGAFAHLSDAYFEAVAVNAATTSRAAGAILQMRDLGVDKYVFVSVLDERTTEICQHMDGKEFSVADAAARIDEMVKSGDPKATKTMHGWNPRGFQDVLNAAGVTLAPGKSVSASDATKIMDEGFAFPPLHHRCRSTVDIA